jgi:hypothetical protein
VRCPAGLASQARHSGGAGAPPGSTMRPCQELADDRKVYAKRVSSKTKERGALTAKARPGRPLKLPHVARREAPAVVRKDRGAIGLRFSARHPFGAHFVGFVGDLQTPDASHASRQQRSTPAWSRRSNKRPALPLWESTTARFAQSVRGQLLCRVEKRFTPHREALSHKGRGGGCGTEANRARPG